MIYKIQGMKISLLFAFMQAFSKLNFIVLAFAEQLCGLQHSLFFRFA